MDDAAPSPASKATLRREALARRAGLDAGQRAAAAQCMAALGCEAVGWIVDPPAIVAGYCALEGELDPAPLLAALRQAGFRLALPRMAGDSLAFHAYEIGDPLETGAFGVQQPAANQPLVQPALILAPMVAFDRKGQRIGYGKGFYDRAFAAHKPARRVGLAFAVQEVPAVPAEPHDMPLDGIITEAGFRLPDPG